MMKGRNNGKKLMAVRIVAHAFEIIHLLTDQNPIQVWLVHQGPFALTYICVGPG
jgi:ribosomal protein S7